MLTRRGWLLAGTSVGFAVAGRVLGIAELYALAAAGGALVVGSVLYVRLTRFNLEASRDLHPPRVHAGGSSRVELAVRNVGARRSPLLAVRDPFDRGARWARFLVSPLLPGETARAAYRLPTDQRGVFDLGPLQLQLSDPLALASVSATGAPATKLTVYPRVDRIEPLPYTLGNDPHAGADHPTALGSTGEDFYALRPYEQGDDLRRVHWPSTAKVDELMIRQDEMPWQGRATVVLDLRRRAHNAISVELAVSAAASVVSASWRHRSLVRLLSTNGVDSGFAAGHAHVEAILEHLATARADSAGDLAGVVTTLRRDNHGGALVVITTAAAADADLEAIARLRARYGLVTLVLFERSSFEPVGGGRHREKAIPPVGTAVRVTAERGFAPAWNRVVTPAKVRA